MEVLGRGLGRVQVFDVVPVRLIVPHHRHQHAGRGDRVGVGGRFILARPGHRGNGYTCPLHDPNHAAHDRGAVGPRHAPILGRGAAKDAQVTPLFVEVGYGDNPRDPVLGLAIVVTHAQSLAPLL